MRSGLILKKEKKLLVSDSDDLGDIYTLTAMKTDTRLFLSHHEGGRTTEDAIALFRDVEQRRSIRSPIPVFIMAEGITDHVWNLREMMTFKVHIQ